MSNTARYAALCGAGLFALAIAASIVLAPPDGFTGAPPFATVVPAVLFILFHLCMLPVIAELRAPLWAAGSGYAWVAVDNMLEVMALFGIGAELIIPMRWGIHLAFAVWVIGASLALRGFARWLGVAVTLLLVATTFAGPYLGDMATVAQTTGPSAVLFIVWLIVVARKSRVVNETAHT